MWTPCAVKRDCWSCKLLVPTPSGLWCVTCIIDSVCTMFYNTGPNYTNDNLCILVVSTFVHAYIGSDLSNIYCVMKTVYLHFKHNCHNFCIKQMQKFEIQIQINMCPSEIKMDYLVNCTLLGWIQCCNWKDLSIIAYFVE